MSFVFPTIAGRMGSTDYFQLCVRVNQLVALVRPAGELAEWATWTLEERLQRDLIDERVSGQLVPYLLNSADRFFGSLIVVALGRQTLSFEPLDGDGMLGAYRSAADQMGFLTVTEGTFVALDGQHRLVALREIVCGQAQSNQAASLSIAEDWVSVILIQHQTNEKTRRIFNMVNRHARPTTKSENVLTSEDDGYAIVARRLALPRAHNPFGTGPFATAIGYDLVDWRSTTLGRTNRALITGNMLYECTKKVLHTSGFVDLDERHRAIRPSDSELQAAYDTACAWWQEVLFRMPPYQNVIDGKANAATQRDRYAPHYILFKPVGQMALTLGLLRCAQMGTPLQDALSRLRRLDWSHDASEWYGNIISLKGYLNSQSTSIQLAAEVIARKGSGSRYGAAQSRELTKRIRQSRGST